MTPKQIAQAQAAARAWKPAARPNSSQRTSSPSRKQPSGNLIARIQAMLAELGYDTGSADGVAGEQTRAAIRSYQSHSGLPITGEASPSLYDTIAADLGIDTPAPGSGARPSTPSHRDPASVTQRPSESSLSSRPIARAMTELVEVIEDAERRRAANREVLDRLRGLVARYSQPMGAGAGAPSLSSSMAAPRRIAFDSFNDGDFQHNPAWTVRSGRFWIDKQHRLRTEVAPADGARESSKDDLPFAILGAILGQQGGVQSVSDNRAVIDLNVEVPAGFEIKMSFSASKGPGTLELSLLSPNGSQHDQTLRIAFAESSMRLTLVTGAGRTLDAVTLQTTTRDRVVRGLEWRQYADGRTVVMIEGRKVLQPQVQAKEGSVSTVRIANLNGRYAIDFIEVSDLGRGRY